MGVPDGWRIDAGMANGGVVDSANGGEYDNGTTAFCGVGGNVDAATGVAAGLKADTGRETTLVLELGLRDEILGFFDAWSSSTLQSARAITLHRSVTYHLPKH